MIEKDGYLKSLPRRAPFESLIISDTERHITPSVAEKGWHSRQYVHMVVFNRYSTLNSNLSLPVRLTAT